MYLIKKAICKDSSSKTKIKKKIKLKESSGFVSLKKKTVHNLHIHDKSE